MKILSFSKALQFHFEHWNGSIYWVLISYTLGEVWLYDSKFSGKPTEKPGAADLPGVYRSAVVNGGLLVAVIAV